MKEKEKSYRLEDSLIAQQRQYHLNLEEAKAQVKDAIKKISYKWTDELSRMEEDLQIDIRQKPYQ